MNGAYLYMIVALCLKCSCSKAFRLAFRGIQCSTKERHSVKPFKNFDVKKVAKFTEADIERLMQDEGIIRARAKILATINGAKAYLAIEKEGEDFSKFIWGLAGGQPIQNDGKERIITSELSEKLSKELKKRGFKFVGPVIVYAYMQAVGIVNDHDAHCFRKPQCAALGKKRSALK